MFNERLDGRWHQDRQRWFIQSDIGKTALGDSTRGVSSRFYGIGGSLTSCDDSIPDYHFELKEIKTEPLELRSAPEAFSRTVLLSWAGDFVSFAPDHVTVSVAFQPTLMSRQFDHVEVAVRNLGGGVRAKLVPPRLDLTVQGPQRVLSSYALEAGSVYVDAAGLEPGNYRVTPKIELPQSIEVTRREPEVQTLEVTAKGGR